MASKPCPHGRQHRLRPRVQEPAPRIHVSTVYRDPQFAEFPAKPLNPRVRSLKLRRHPGGDGSPDRSDRTVVHHDILHASSSRLSSLSRIPGKQADGTMIGSQGVTGKQSDAERAEGHVPSTGGATPCHVRLFERAERQASRAASAQRPAQAVRLALERARGRVNASVGQSSKDATHDRIGARQVPRPLHYERDAVRPKSTAPQIRTRVFDRVVSIDTGPEVLAHAGWCVPRCRLPPTLGDAGLASWT